LSTVVTVTNFACIAHYLVYVVKKHPRTLSTGFSPFIA